MNKKLIVAACLLFTLGWKPAQAQQWPKALPEAKAGLRWWWFGSAVDSANLSWSLGQYASHGAGAVEITPIYGVKGQQNRNIPYLSDRWMEMLRYTEDQAARNHIEVDMATGTGWPFGGPWVPLSESASKMVIVDTTVVGKKFSSLDLSPRQTRPGTQLAAVVVFGQGQSSPLLTVTQFGDEGKSFSHEYSGGQPSPSSFVSRWAVQETLSDGRLQSLLQLKLRKKGSWRIIALYRQPGVMKVKRPAPGGEGWVIDHFDKKSVTHYLQHIESAFERTHTPYPHTFFNDSYEVAQADFTPSLFAEFQSRRGYSLLEHLDQLVDGDQQVVADYRETLSDLLLENFTQTWTAWAHSHGAITRNQAHGSPANLIDCYAAVDIPEIEGFGLTDFGIKGLRRDPGFTRKNDADFSMLKYAPSAAHVTGKRFTSSETATWLTEHFRTSLSQIKPDLDLMFCAGVNHCFFHGTAYSPKDDPWPGWKFYASIDMSPTNSFWRDVPFLMDYIERCQSFLQWGEPDNDFLCYFPVHDLWASRSKGNRLMQFPIHTMNELAPQFVDAVNRIEDAGFDCDYISDRLLMQTRVDHGRLITPGGTRYRALVITDPKNILPKALRQHLDSLKAQGAPIIIGVDASDLNRANVAKPEELKSKWGLHLIRRKNPGGYHYFISNLSPRDVEAYVPMAVPFSNASWFDPMTGKIFAAQLRHDSLRVSLRSGQSLILLTHNTSAASSALPRLPYSPQPQQEVKLTAPWKLSFVESQPANAKTYTLAGPRTWEGLDSVSRTLMGTGVYSTTLNLKRKDLKTDDVWTLELGDVRESARVYVNDSLVGCAWAVPFTVSFSGSLLHPGTNQLRIEVTNLPANRISELDRQGIPWRKMEDINVVNINYKRTTYADWKPVPSGLNSAVRLYRATAGH